MRFRPHPLLSTVGVLALAAPLALVPPGAAAAPPSQAALVSPEPQQLTQRPDGFPITPVVGLVRGKDSDADSERVLRQVLQRAGVRTRR